MADARGTDDTEDLGGQDTVTFKNLDDTSSSLFDLRYLIGALFTFYGVLLTVASFFTDNTKAGGVDINLWLGLGMLVLGVFFLGWARARPLHVEGVAAGAAVEDEAGRRPSSF
jgi:hypothetical protein